MRVPSWLGRAAAVQPDRTAIETEAGSLTYAELHDAAAGVDLPAGARVAIALPPGLDFAVALHACLGAGAVAVPVDLRLAERERAVVCAGAELVIDAPIRSGGRHDRPRSRGHDLDAPAVVIHTSGTTGPPRPVVLTYGNLLWSALGSATAIGLDPAERWLCPLPVAHVGGLSILVRSAIYATTAVVHARFETAAVLAALMDGAITVVSLVPTTLARLLDAGLRDPPSLRCALIGGAPLPAALTERALAAGVPVSQTYGLSEAASQVTTQMPGDGGSDAGPPLFCTRVRIEGGEIQVAGPTLAPRAAPAPAGETEVAAPAAASGNAAAGPPGPVADGAGSAAAWLATGDLGELVDGRLRVTGRRVDTIVSGGENIAPTEVEAALADHPSVAEAAVVGVPDPDWGEAVRALVVLRPGGPPVDGAELRAHCRERLAAFKVPKEFVFVETLPRTGSGKLARRELASERTA
jgi:O-succinylbenzoic acid--CoA ligase